MKKTLCALLTALFCLTLFAPAALAAPAEDTGAYDLYVSPAGDDLNLGTPDAPLATPAGAQARLRAMKVDVPPGQRVTVHFAPGTYEIKDTLRFTAEDLPDVTFRGEGGEVIFSGAREIAGFTEETVNGVRTFVKTLSKEEGGFKSLFKDGERLTQPRWPETGYFTVKALAPEDDIWTAENTPWEFTLGQRSFYADPKDLGAGFTNPEDVQVRVLHYWHDELATLTSVDYETGKLGLSRPSSMRIGTIDRYYFENVFEAMNEPGEWYLNNATDTLYYVPEEGETAQACVLRASSLEQLLTVDGVSGLAFENVCFTETDWNVPKPGEWESDWRAEYDIDALQAALDVPGAVAVRNAEDVFFTNCEFIALGADGIKMADGVRGARVENCVFREIAGTAVFAGSGNVQPDDPAATGDITVKNNLIKGYGRKFYCAIGVHLTYCDGAEIANNEISDGYYTAISCGWNWGYGYHLTRNIQIKDNLIYNVGQGWLSDMGGIYMLGVQPGTVLSGNVIHNVAANPGDGGYGGWGIYLDEGSSRMLIEENLVFCCASQAYNIHYGEGNVFRNNIGALCAEGQVSFGSRPDETHATSFWYDNVFLTDGAPVYVHMHGTDHFYENGNLLWDIKKGAKLTFSLGEGSVLSLAQAQRQGFLHNAEIADPLFRDPEGFDFTPDENSPAFALNFKAWDYSRAGTIKGSTLGLSQPGGETAIADFAARAERTGQKTGGAEVSTWLTPVAIALGLLVMLFWLLRALLRAPGREALAFGCLLFGILAAWFTRGVFIKWAPVPYVLGSIALCAAAAALPLALIKRKKAFVAFIVRFVIVLAVFYGVVLTLNNGLRIGETNVMAAALTALGVYAAVVSVLALRKDKTAEA